MDSFDQLGREEYLVWLGKRKPEAYAALLRAVLPVELKAQLNADGVAAVIIKSYVGRAAQPVIDAEPLPPRIEG